MSDLLLNKHWDSISRPKARNKAKRVIACKLVQFDLFTLIVSPSKREEGGNIKLLKW